MNKQYCRNYIRVFLLIKKCEIFIGLIILTPNGKAAGKIEEIRSWCLQVKSASAFLSFHGIQQCLCTEKFFFFVMDF